MADLQNFKLTGAGDIDITGGTLNIVDDDSAVKEQLKVNMTLFKNDWFLNQDEGIDYFEKVFGKKYITIEMISQLKLAILETVGVQTIKDFSAELADDRELMVSYKVLTQFSEIADTTNISI